MNKTYEVNWTEIAINDLSRILEYLAIDDFMAAQKVYLRIKEKAKKLEILPFRGRVIPELKELNIESYREIIENPWRIIYKVENNVVFVLSVIDGRRNVEDILLERFLSE